MADSPDFTFAPEDVAHSPGFSFDRADIAADLDEVEQEVSRMLSPSPRAEEAEPAVPPGQSAPHPSARGSTASTRTPSSDVVFVMPPAPPQLSTGHAFRTVHAHPSEGTTAFGAYVPAPTSPPLCSRDPIFRLQTAGGVVLIQNPRCPPADKNTELMAFWKAETERTVPLQFTKS